MQKCSLSSQKVINLVYKNQSNLCEAPDLMQRLNEQSVDLHTGKTDTVDYDCDLRFLIFLNRMFDVDELVCTVMDTVLSIVL